MTRRGFFSIAAATSAPAPLILRIHRVMDRRAKCTPDELQRFWSRIWSEAVRDFQRAGIEIRATQATGEVKRSPGGRPVFTGLERGAINLVLTDHIPMLWDKGRALAGATTRYEGCVVCMIALSFAHGHQIPFLSLNTCVHELLHVLLQDIFQTHPEGLAGEGREFRIDWYATRLWLFHDGDAIRKSAQAWLDRASRLTVSAM